MRRTLTILAISLITAAHAQTWTMTFLAPEKSQAYGVNDQGQVVGHFTPTPGFYHAFLWQNGVRTDIAPDAINASAQAISDTGFVALQLFDQSGHYTSCRWNAGNRRYVTEGYIRGVNDAGDVVGHKTSLPDGAYVYQAATGITLLDTRNDDNWAYSINNHGQIAGYTRSTGPAASPHVATVWDNGSMRTLSWLPGHGGSEAYGINDAGLVVGVSFVNSPAFGVAQPVLWPDDGTIVDLGVPSGANSGWALGINDEGQVTGWGFSGSLSWPVAGFFWENGVLKNLNACTKLSPTSGPIIYANAVNNLGQIAGGARAMPGAIPSGVLLNPVYGDANADYAVDMKDVTLLMQTAAGLATVPCVWIADVAPKPSASPRGFGDGKLDLADAARVLRKVQGVETVWP